MEEGHAQILLTLSFVNHIFCWRPPPPTLTSFLHEQPYLFTSELARPPPKPCENNRSFCNCRDPTQFLVMTMTRTVGRRTTELYKNWNVMDAKLCNILINVACSVWYRAFIDWCAQSPLEHLVVHFGCLLAVLLFKCRIWWLYAVTNSSKKRIKHFWTFYKTVKQ